jgi:hypothetical protein
MSNKFEAVKRKGKAMLAALHAQGQTEKIRIEFSGQGDSGDMHEVNGIEEDHPLYEQVKEWSEEMTEFFPDYCNNDGGFGHIEMDPMAQTIEYEVSQYSQTSEIAAKEAF